MSKIVWEDPPARATRGSADAAFTKEIRDALVTREGQWAVVYEAEVGATARNRASAWRYRWPAYEFRTAGKKIYAKRRTETHNE